MKEILARLVNSIVRIPESSGLVVGLLQGSGTQVHRFGQIDEPEGDRLFEIGSISKVFTTALLAHLVGEGKLALDAQVRELVPELVNLPPSMTLLSLATHTSGLPKMPSNSMVKMLRNRSNPYADYSTKDMLSYLARLQPGWLQRRQGRIEYSNLGVGLLGFILAEELGGSLEQAIEKRISAPLGMNDTRINLPRELRARLAPPRLSNGRPASNWDMPAFEGAGGVRSTAADMMRFLQANLGQGDSSLKRAIQMCHEVRARDFAPPGPIQKFFAGIAGGTQSTERYREGIGLGWVIGTLKGDGSQIHWHHGATGGYRAFAGFVKDHGTGVVVLANTRPSARDLFLSSTATDLLGFEILENLSAQH